MSQRTVRTGLRLLAAVAGAIVAGAACTAPAPASEPTAPRLAPAAHYAGPVIDTHVHVFFDGESGARRDTGSPESVLRQARLPRVAKLGVIVVAARPGIEQTRALNDRLAALVQEAPDRLFAIGSVHPADGEAALRELERIKGLGFRMLKLHPIMQQLDVGSPEVSAIVHKAGELGLPVLFDFSGILNAADLGKYVLLAAQNPDAKLVLAHMGGTKFHELLVLSMLREYAWYRNNVWVDLSAVAQLYARSPYRDQLVYVCRKIGVDRVLFGSDFPFVRATAEAIDDVESLGFLPAEERLIFHDTAAALLGFPPAPR